MELLFDLNVENEGPLIGIKEASSCGSMRRALLLPKALDDKLCSTPSDFDP